jgi:hypothetical protein
MSVPETFKECLTVFENFEKSRKYSEFSKPIEPNKNFLIKKEIS